MIALLLAAQAILSAPFPAGVDGTSIGVLAQQELPASGCAAYLWSAGATHALVAMASASPARLRVTLDGKQIDLPRAGEEGAGALGFAATTRYQLGDVAATLDLTVETSAALAGGARVPAATLRVEAPGRDGVAMPVAGLIGCAAA